MRARLADAHATTDISGPVAARHDAVLQGRARLGENIREMPKAMNLALAVLAPIAITEVEALGCVDTSRILALRGAHGLPFFFNQTIAAVAARLCHAILVDGAAALKKWIRKC